MEEYIDPGAKIEVTARSDGIVVKINTASVLKDGRIYVPIRYVAEALGAYVDKGVASVVTASVFSCSYTADRR